MKIFEYILWTRGTCAIAVLSIWISSSFGPIVSIFIWIWYSFEFDCYSITTNTVCITQGLSKDQKVLCALYRPATKGAPYQQSWPIKFLNCYLFYYIFSQPPNICLLHFKIFFQLRPCMCIIWKMLYVYHLKNALYHHLVLTKHARDSFKAFNHYQLFF